ncbi:MAG: hypothetical protein COS84_06620 [Armatimonadetes bacterium CG07_land_8_20_14_0_80_40_9]|nr:MAG: hypothetical protein COS84_06620 [Armatimonadetes bacterium CG07_land_8_20_14_0_80_40_9]
MRLLRSFLWNKKRSKIHNGVSTKRLNEQVKRNIKRFPEDFMFKLTKIEKEEVVAICDHLKVLKFSSQLPYAFTEQGVAMLSSVLHSERAIARQEVFDSFFDL